MTFKVFASFLLIIFSQSSIADGLLLSYGKSSSKDESKARELSYIFQFENTFKLTETIPLSLELELSYSDWQNLYGPDITGGAILPLWIYTTPWGENELFLKLGIGAAYISGTQWGNRTLGDNWIFKDKLSVGINFLQQHALSLSIVHYSNASLHKNNDGTNIFYVNYNLYW